jgi:hypothetical protein
MRRRGDRPQAPESLPICTPRNNKIHIHTEREGEKEAYSGKRTILS